MISPSVSRQLPGALSWEPSPLQRGAGALLVHGRGRREGEAAGAGCEPGAWLPAGIHRNESRLPCSTIPITKEISHAGCAKNVTMNYCAGSCGTFAM